MNKKTILQYLNCYSDIDEKNNSLIDECVLEVKEMAHFKAVSQKYTLSHFPLMIQELNLEFSSQDLEFLMNKCHECLIVAGTLGLQIDRQIKYYEHIDMAKAIVFDAVSNCYLEECLDEYEKLLHLGQHTFRFAPGYGDLSLEFNKPLSKALQLERTLGVFINDGGLFIPMKTILGIIGIGQTGEKSCMACIRKEQCEIRKGGQKCYVKD